MKTKTPKYLARPELAQVTGLCPVKIPSPACSASSAFTLIELLTVIAIIGILAAIILPTVGKVRQSARSAQCLSNLRQIGMAVTLYAVDDKDQYPYGYININNADRRWSHQISSYLASRSLTEKKRSNDVFFCQQESVKPNASTATRTNYSANPRVMPQEKADGSTKRVKVTGVLRPSQVIMVADGAVNPGPNNPGVCDWGFYDQTVNSSINLAETAVKDEGDQGNAHLSWRHGGKVQAVFVDGHAKAFAVGELRYKHLVNNY
ncbi:DUF1559 domain-containing protein [Opitutaceae bacterium TAV4]|nr:DUF1559 domain-containing protein [Opitutaceae bacterium TAV4]RRK00287.1 DUF1559 domain-containing protein [Opitutaceae bacterium TAV3]